MLQFSIPYPSTKIGKTEWNHNYSLNAYYAGKHWKDRAADAEYWHVLVRSQLPRHHMFTSPVILRFYFNDALDISNHAAVAKMIEDALKGTIIKDDSRKFQ